MPSQAYSANSSGLCRRNSLALISRCRWVSTAITPINRLSQGNHCNNAAAR